ncbi:MAG: PDGLE domain-containing protein [Micromonosporaceae bacterium]|nr:PDGLE domain-containing protein [Micromonosporaceae bacterium]
MTRKLGWFLGAGLLVAVALAGVVSNFASSHPDGLESVIHQGCELNEDGEIIGGECVAQRAQDHELADSPFADYGLAGVDNAVLGTAVSGVLGVLVTFAVGAGVFWLVRRRGRNGATAGALDSGSAAGSG